MIDDAHRGYLLELMTTKLMSLDTEQAIQIIAMSATLPVSIAGISTSKVCVLNASLEHGPHGTLD